MIVSDNPPSTSYMDRISITLPEKHLKRLDELSGENKPYDSRSEAIREIIREYDHLQDRVSDLEDDVSALKAERDDLRRQLREVNSRNDDVDELMEYIREEKSLQQEERERRNAPVWMRAKFWIFGRKN